MAYNRPSFTPAGILRLGIAATGALVATALLRDRLRSNRKPLALPRARSFSEPSSAPLQDPMHGARPGVVMSSDHQDDDQPPARDDTQQSASSDTDSGAKGSGKKGKSEKPGKKTPPPDKAEPVVEHNHDKD